MKLATAIKKAIKYTLLGLFALLLLLIIFALWLSCTESGLRWSSQRILSVAPGLEIKSSRGRLIGPLSIDGLHYKNQQVDIDIEHIRFNWLPSELFYSTVSIEELALRKVSINTRDNTPTKIHDEEPTPPSLETLLEKLQLPIAIRLSKLTINDISYNQQTKNKSETEAPLTVSHFALSGQSDSQKIRIDNITLNSSIADVDGIFTLNLSRNGNSQGEINWLVKPKDIAAIKGSTTLAGNAKELSINSQLSPPYNSTSSISIQSLFDKPQAEAKLSINNIDTIQIKSEWPSYTIAGNITIDGELDDATINSQLQLTTKTLIKDETTSAQITTQAKWSKQNLQLSLNASAAHLIENIQLNGTIKPALFTNEEDKAFDLSVHWKNLLPPSNKKSLSPLTSPKGEAMLSGNLKNYQFSLTSLFEEANGKHEKDKENGTLLLSGVGSQQSIGLEKITLSGLAGSMYGSGKITFKPSLEANMTLSGKALNPGVLSPQWPGNLTLNLDVDAQTIERTTTIQAKVNSNGVLRQHPFSFKTKALYQLTNNKNYSLHLDNTQLRSGSSTLTNSLRIEKEKLYTQWNLSSQNLNELHPDLHGQLNSNGNIDSMTIHFDNIDNVKPKINAQFTARSLAMAKYTIAKVDGNIDIDWQTNSSTANNRININTQNITSDGINITSASISANGTPDAHRLSANIDSDKGKGSFGLDGNLKQAVWYYTLDEAELSPSDLAPWKLSQNAIGKISVNEQFFEDFCWSTDTTKNNPANLCIKGKRNTKLTRLHFSIEKLPINYFKTLFPDNLEWTDTKVSGEGLIEIPNNSPFISQINLVSTQGKLSWKNKSQTDRSPGKSKRQSIHIEPGKLSIVSDKKTIQTSLLLPIENQTGITGQINIANTEPSFIDNAISGNFSLKLNNIAPFASFIPDASQLSGKLDSQWRLGGQIKKPWLEGELNLDKGQVRLNSPGLLLENVSLHLTGNKQEGIRYRAYAASGGGSVNSDGKILLKEHGPEFSLSVTGNNLQVLNNTEAVVYASPELNITTTDKLINIEGNITIPTATLTPQKLPESIVSTSEDQVILSSNGTDKIINKQVIQTNINLILGDSVSVDGFGFKGRTTGTLAVTKNAFGPTLGNGKIHILDGEYRALGQGLVIEKGDIIFSESPIGKPGVDIKALRRPAEGITVGVYARGPLTKPELSIFSEPNMPQTEQLSWLVLGRSPNQISEGENNALNQLLLALALNKGDTFLTGLTDTFNLDTLTIKTGSGEAGAASDNDLAELVLGKYLSPDLYVSYGIGLFKPVNVLSLEYTLGKHWKLKSETSSEFSGGDLVYTIEK